MKKEKTSAMAKANAKMTKKDKPAASDEKATKKGKGRTSAKLLMPEIVVERLTRIYSEANVILEYGSGGSTVLASNMPNKKVFAVESDLSWMKKLNKRLRNRGMADGTEVHIHHVDIGPTRAWGFPETDEKWTKYAAYPLSVWDLENFPQPDVVLLDGRFRAGCALATLFRTQKPVTLLFDDYATRKHYHRVEQFLGKPEMVDRMAIFEVKPQPLPADKLLTIIRMMTQPA